VQLVDISSCKRQLVVEVPAELVETEIDELARRHARQAKVPGFRPGKVPVSIIKQRYGSDLRHDATHEIIQRTWKDAVMERDLHPLAEPSVEELHNEPGSSLKFTVSFEVLPQLEAKDYRGVSIKISEQVIEEKDTDEAFEALRERHAEYTPVEDSEVRDGHFVTLTVDGEFEGGGKPLHEDDVTCVVGDPQTNETFSQNLRGARAAETRSFDVTYPSDYHRKRFANKTVHYRVTIKDIKEKHLPEPSDDFAKDLGADSLEALRNRLREQLVTNARRTAEEKARESALDSLVQSHSFEVPECMVRDELEDHARRIASGLARQGIDVSKTSIDWKKVFEEERPRAEQAVRRALLLDAIARQENLEVTESELETELEKAAEGTRKSAAALRAQLEKDKRIHSFRAHLRQNKALDFIFRNANITRG